MRFKIVSEKVFEGRNLIAPVPVVRLVLDFAELSDHSPVRLGSEFTACLGEFLSVLEANTGRGNDRDMNSAATFQRDESLRLGHVVVETALALQRTGGAEVSYGAVDTEMDESPARQKLISAH